MPPLGYRRLTPLSTPAAGDPSALSAVPDGWAARGRLRALAVLVDKLAQVGGGRSIMEADPEQQAAVREAVRVLTSRIREDALQCRLVHGQLILAGAPMAPRTERPSCCSMAAPGRITITCTPKCSRLPPTRDC